jgi:TusA-related sulfurtransferase
MGAYGSERFSMTDRARQNAEADVQADAELDLRGVICPYNFVKTKLKLETMGAGQVLAVILDEGDPIRNVPCSVSDDGHTVLRQEPFDRAYRVIIRKRSQ